jgi:osmotically-inducible protein OsmY
MANDYRDRDRFRDRDRGLFGYEGEGYMRGGRDDLRSGFSGGYGRAGGYRDLESGADRGWNIGQGSDYGPGTSGQSFRGRGPKNYQRSDDRIREDVCERLTMDHDVDATEIEVQVQDGVVTLNGTVHERHAKRIAEDICESVRGVKDVQNHLRVMR